jgi:hypothetical protein
MRAKITRTEELRKRLLRFDRGPAWSAVRWAYGKLNVSHLRATLAMKPGRDLVPLYEGPTVTAFDHQGGRVRYWISTAAHGVEPRPKRYRVALRTLAPSMNGRLLVAAVLPPLSVAASSLIVSSPLDARFASYAVAILNSFVLDFVAQGLMAGTTTLLHVTLGLLHQLPLRDPDKTHEEVVYRSSRLLHERSDLDAVEYELGSRGEGGALSIGERNRIRAELEALIADRYELDENDFASILATFIKVPEPERLAARNALRDLQRGLLP